MKCTESKYSIPGRPPDLLESRINRHPYLMEHGVGDAGLAISRVSRRLVQGMQLIVSFSLSPSCSLTSFLFDPGEAVASGSFNSEPPPLKGQLFFSLVRFFRFLLNCISTRLFHFVIWEYQIKQSPCCLSLRIMSFPKEFNYKILSTQRKLAWW